MIFHITPALLRRRVLAGAVAAVAVTGLSLPAAFAQDAAQEPDAPPQISLTPDQIQALMSARSAVAGATASGESFPSFAAVSKDMAEVAAPEGTTPLFKVYKQTSDDARDPSKLLALIPRSLLGDDLLLATSVTSGPLFGYQWSDYLVRFERRGRNLILSVPDMRFVQDQGVVSDAVRQTYTPAVLAVMPIAATGPAGEYVIDLGDLVAGGAVTPPTASGMPRRDLTEYNKVKVFPDNVLVDADVFYSPRREGGGEATSMGFSFRKLPNLKNPTDRYYPREADERVGYFQTARQDWSLKHDVKDTVRRYINRWRVEKLDDSLAMSPPKEPIVFYIEKTVPIQWRRFVKEGIEDWNKAFEEIGIVGAIEVRQQTDTAYDDIDPEDARYNFIRWIVTGRGFAMGPSRVDPRTGQILDADIIFDDSMLRYFQDELNLLSPKEAARAYGQDLGADMLRFWAENPAFAPKGLGEADVRSALTEMTGRNDITSTLGSNFAAAGDPNASAQAVERLRELLGEDHAGHDHVVNKASRMTAGAGCEYANGVSRQLGVAHLAMLAQAAPTTLPATRPAESEPSTRPADMADEKEGRGVKEASDEFQDEVSEGRVDEKQPKGELQSIKLPERYLGLVLKEVVAHEVGHTLGLRHNFKASAWLSLDEVRERQKENDKPLVASVMDYNPVILFTGDDPKNVETFITPTVGPYDLWAIEYGYTITKRGQDKGTIDKIASRAGEEALAYATDEDTMGLISPDPFVNRYDMGDDPIAWSKSRVALVDTLMDRIGEWAVDEGEPNDYLRKTYMGLYNEKVRNMSYVSRLVGGQRFSRARFGDEVEGPDRPGLTPLDPAMQREAIDFLAETLFQDDFLRADPELLNKLVPSRSGGLDTWPTSRIDFPVHDMILRAQNYGLATLTNPTVLQRIYDAQLKTTGDDKFTAAEAIRKTTDAVWGVLDDAGDGEYTDAEPMLSSVRRNLQEQHLSYLLALADSEPGRLMSADLRTLVRYHLRTLAEEIGTLKADKGDAIDMASMAHLVESKDLIEKVLNAPYIDLPAGGGSTIIIMGQEK